MQKLFVFHPASASSLTVDGSLSLKREGSNFAWWEQQFEPSVDQRCFFENNVVPTAINTTVNLTVSIILKQLITDVANIVLRVGYRQLNPAANEDRDSVALTQLPLQIIPLPGTAGQEFIVTFTIPAGSLVAGRELLLSVTRLGTNVNDTHLQPISIVRVDVDSEVIDSSFWSSGLAPGQIFYGGGNVGIGTNNPSEGLQVTGAILIGTTVNNTPGTIRYTGTDFEGRLGSGWVSLTIPPGGNTLGQAYNEGGAGAGRTITVAGGLPVLINGVTPSGLQLINNMRIEYGTISRGFTLYNSALSVFQHVTAATYGFNIETGNSPGATSGTLNINTGAGDVSGNLIITTGNAAVGATGEIQLVTGTPLGVGVRGNITVDGFDVLLNAAQTLQCSGTLNIGLSSPTILVSASSSLTLSNSVSNINLLAGPSTNRQSVIVGEISDGTLITGSSTPNKVVIRNGRTDIDTAAAELVLYNKNGVAYRLWIDASGVLRVGNHTTDVDGTVIGTQT